MLSALLGLGCSTVTGSGVATGAPGGPVAAVWIRAVSLPGPGREVGLVEAKAHGELLHELVPEFARQVAALGGNCGLVDRVSSRFELETHVETYAYGCGKTTCLGTRTVTREVETLTMLGRAFWVDRD